MRSAALPVVGGVVVAVVLIVLVVVVVAVVLVDVSLCRCVASLPLCYAIDVVVLVAVRGFCSAADVAMCVRPRVR